MLYRFRSAKSILEFGELEKHEIYFSALDSLNDPTEGLHEIFWNGDEIVWINLFKYFALHFIENEQIHLSISDRESLINNFIEDNNTISIIKHLCNIDIEKHQLNSILSIVSFILDEHIDNKIHHLSTSNKKKRKTHN